MKITGPTIADVNLYSSRLENFHSACKNGSFSSRQLRFIQLLIADLGNALAHAALAVLAAPLCMLIGCDVRQVWIASKTHASISLCSAAAFLLSFPAVAKPKFAQEAHRYLKLFEKPSEAVQKSWLRRQGAKINHLLFNKKMLAAAALLTGVAVGVIAFKYRNHLPNGPSDLDTTPNPILDELVTPKLDNREFILKTVIPLFSVTALLILFPEQAGQVSTLCCSTLRKAVSLSVLPVLKCAIKVTRVSLEKLRSLGSFAFKQSWSCVSFVAPKVFSKLVLPTLKGVWMVAGEGLGKLRDIGSYVISRVSLEAILRDGLALAEWGFGKAKSMGAYVISRVSLEAILRGGLALAEWGFGKAKSMGAYVISRVSLEAILRDGLALAEWGFGKAKSMGAYVISRVSLEAILRGGLALAEWGFGKAKSMGAYVISRISLEAILRGGLALAEWGFGKAKSMGAYVISRISLEAILRGGLALAEWGFGKAKSMGAYVISRISLEAILRGGLALAEWGFGKAKSMGAYVISRISLEAILRGGLALAEWGFGKAKSMGAYVISRISLEAILRGGLALAEWGFGKAKSMGAYVISRVSFEPIRRNGWELAKWSFENLKGMGPYLVSKLPTQETLQAAAIGGATFIGTALKVVVGGGVGLAWGTLRRSTISKNMIRRAMNISCIRIVMNDLHRRAGGRDDFNPEYL